MLISFSGIDGCGKTTLSAYVVEFLRDRGLKARCIRVTDAAISRKAGNLLKKICHKKTKTAAVSSGKGIAIFRKATLVFDVLVFWVVLLWSRLTKTSLVCDRYFFDSIVHLNYLGISSALFGKFLLAFAPRPDIAFLLVVPPDVARGRDRDFSADFYEKKHSCYVKIFEGINGVEVENNNLDSATRQVKERIAALLEKKK